MQDYVLFLFHTVTSLLHSAAGSRKGAGLQQFSHFTFSGENVNLVFLTRYFSHSHVTVGNLCSALRAANLTRYNHSWFPFCIR